MQLITVNHSLNQTFHVEFKAIEQAVKKSISRLRGYKLEEMNIVASSSEKNINVVVEVTIPESITMSVGITKVNKSIEESITNLLDSKPRNIEIKVNK